jgi:hypothetical protein
MVNRKQFVINPEELGTRWFRPRGPVIETNGMTLISSRSPTESYDPKESLELPDRLAEVATGLTTPVEFVQEYGLLGFQNFVLGEGIPPVEFGDPPAEYVFAAKPSLKKLLAAPVPLYLSPGEPLSWFNAHALTVRRSLELLGYFRLKDTNKLRATLLTLPKANYAALGVTSEEGAFEWVPEFAKIDLARATRAALAALINPNLVGVHRELRPDAFGNLRYELKFEALIQVVYWHLARRVEDEKAIPKFCKRCGEPFFHRDPRQQYCPKPLGKIRSLCGNRAVKEAFRARWPSGISERAKRSNPKKKRRK